MTEPVNEDSARETPVPIDSAEQMRPEFGQPQPPMAPVSAVAVPSDDDHAQYRKYFLYVLIGGVVASALISVVAILIGEFDDTITRALWTTLLTMAHAAVVLALMSATTSRRRDVGDELMVNVLYGIAIASYFTSVLSVWRVISGEVTGDFYQLYFNTFITVLVLQGVLKIRIVSVAASRLKQALIGTIALLWAYLIPSVFDNSTPKVLPSIYYRGVAALVVVLGTIAVLMTIFHRLYLTHHPELKAAAPMKKPRISVGILLLIIVAALFVLPTILGVLYTIVTLLFSGL